MIALAAIAVGAGIGLGVLLVIQGLRGRAILPTSSEVSVTDVAPYVPWGAGALIGALIVLSITGWPVAAIATLVGVGSIAIRRSRADDKHNTVARTEAIASWTEMIRDNMAGAAGLEHALMAASQVAPAAIRPEVRRFSRRLDDQPLAEALAVLGEELDHPSADLVVAALSNAARMETRDLGGLLGRLADSIRSDVRMRLRVEVGRARIRTSARIVMAVTVLTALFIFVFSRDLLAVYDSPAGQAWLVMVLGVFVLGAWLLDRFSQIDMPERFTARRIQNRSAR
ncbi:MAG: type II secretion system F family protein [Actinomycetota bacterium]